MTVLCDQCGEPIFPLANYCSYCGAQAPQKTVLLDPKDLNGPEDPVYCPVCKQSNPHDALYCNHCGRYLFDLPEEETQFCPKCSEQNRSSAKRCASCGLSFSDWFSMKGSIAESFGLKGSFTLHETMNDTHYHFIKGKEEFSVGRNPDNDLAIPAPWVSGKHCFLDLKEGLLVDDNSTNGTYINRVGKRITKIPLEHVREFNVAGYFTFSVIELNNAFIFSLTAILDQETCKKQTDFEQIEEIRNHYFVFPSGDTRFFVDITDGEVTKRPEPGQHVCELKAQDGYYYFSQKDENIIDHLLLQKHRNLPVNWKIIY